MKTEPRLFDVCVTCSEEVRHYLRILASDSDEAYQRVIAHLHTKGALSAPPLMVTFAPDFPEELTPHQAHRLCELGFSVTDGTRIWRNESSKGVLYGIYVDAEGTPQLAPPFSPLMFERVGDDVVWRRATIGSTSS